MGFCLRQEFCSCIYIYIYFFRVLGYRTIDSKVCQENRVGKKKSLTTIFWRISCLWYSGSHLLASVCSARKSQSTEWKWMPLLWFVLIRSVKKRCLAIFLWLYLCFYPCPIALWTSLQLGNASTMDWKSLWIFIVLAKNTYAKPQYLAKFYLHFNTIKLQQ